MNQHDAPMHLEQDEILPPADRIPRQDFKYTAGFPRRLRDKPGAPHEHAHHPQKPENNTQCAADAEQFTVAWIESTKHAAVRFSRRSL